MRVKFTEFTDASRKDADTSTKIGIGCGHIKPKLIGLSQSEVCFCLYLFVLIVICVFISIFDTNDVASI